MNNEEKIIALKEVVLFLTMRLYKVNDDEPSDTLKENLKQIRKVEENTGVKSVILGLQKYLNKEIDLSRIKYILNQCRGVIKWLENQNQKIR